MRIAISALALEGRPESLGSGIARYCFSLVDALLELDSEHRFAVWTSPCFEPPDSWARHPRCELHAAKGPFAGFKTLWELFAAGGVAHRSGCDVWLSTAHALPLRWPGPAVLAVQDLFTFTHPEFYTLKHRLVIGAAMRRALARADGIVAISEHTREELTGRFGVSDDRITVTPLAPFPRSVRTGASRVDREELARLGVGGEHFVMTLSTIEPRKNLPRLVEAFALLAGQDRFAGLRLVVAGSSGWKTGPSLATPAALGVEDRVDFLGFVADDDLPTLFAACEAFVLPSIIEGFGLPLLEALPFGMPVACSRSGSLPEVGGELPIYFDPLDVEDMAAALTRALTSDRTREERAETASGHLARFSWRTTAERTLERLERTGERR